MIMRPTVANRLSFSDDPSYGQGTLAQMENYTLTIGAPTNSVSKFQNSNITSDFDDFFGYF